MGIKKVKTIAKAFLEPLPAGEKWYEDRLKICEYCPHNSKNVKEEEKSDRLIDRVKSAIEKEAKKHLCDNGNSCTLCGCCIERKCATKSEQCGKVKIGEAPLWEALEIQSAVSEDIQLINETPGIGNLVMEGKSFSYNVEDRDEKKVSFSFDVVRKGNPLEIKNYRPSCSCVSVKSMDRKDVSTFNFKIDVSTLGFKSGWNDRKLYIAYFERNQRVKEITLIIKIKMP